MPPRKANSLTRTATEVVVRAGESLWTIAARDLGPLATDVEIALRFDGDDAVPFDNQPREVRVERAADDLGTQLGGGQWSSLRRHHRRAGRRAEGSNGLAGQDHPLDVVAHRIGEAERGNAIGKQHDQIPAEAGHIRDLEEAAGGCAIRH